MQRLFVMSRARDNRRFEFFSDTRGGKDVYVIREVSAASQDSVTPDRDTIEAFKASLLSEGYMETSF